MPSPAASAGLAAGPIVYRVIGGLRVLALLATYAAQPVLRIALALPFIRSGLTRWDGFLSISPATSYLFANIFKLHILGGAYPLPFPDQMAFVTASAEMILPMLLILGLGTRLSAVGLLAMTGVIQLVIPDGWANFHLYWAAIALAIIALGPGPLSLDSLVARLFNPIDEPSHADR